MKRILAAFDRLPKIALALGLAFVLLVAPLSLYSLEPTPADARDLGGRYANSPLKPWFESLHSRSGMPCCETADGERVSDVDWDTQCADDACHYRVRLLGKWMDVPEEAVITDPNRFGPAVVWPVYSGEGAERTVSFIRCFIPGAGA